jgi:hypothetical protein
VTPSYQEFFEQFGASCRRKYLAVSPLREWASQWKRRVSGKPVKRRYAKRSYRLPPTSPLPNDFIRLDPWEMDYMFMVAGWAKTGMLETGRFNGGSVFLMSWANRTAPLWSIDIAPQNDELLNGFLRQFGIGKNVTLIVGDSQHGRDPRVTGFDLLFVDGDHSYQGCLNDLENWWPLLEPGGHVLVHDCYAGSDVQRATVDFVESHPVEIVRTPYIHAMHLHNPAGSLAHFRKRAAP